jgi:hypothetical protein
MSDGYVLLAQDHRYVEAWLDACGQDQEGAAVRNLATELARHHAIGEGVLYPAVRTMIADGAELVDAARDEDAAIGTLMARAMDSPPADLSPLVEELRVLMVSHVAREEEEMLPRLRDSGIRAETLGAHVEAARDAFTEYGP